MKVFPEIAPQQTDVSNQMLEKVQRELEKSLAVDRAQRLSWYTAQRLAREAYANQCVAVVRFDPTLPNATRIVFVREYVPGFLLLAEEDPPTLLGVQAG